MNRGRQAKEGDGMAMKLSERIHLWIEPHRIPDFQDALDLQAMVEELAQLEAENVCLRVDIASLQASWDGAVKR